MDAQRSSTRRCCSSWWSRSTARRAAQFASVNRRPRVPQRSASVGDRTVLAVERQAMSRGAFAAQGHALGPSSDAHRGHLGEPSSVVSPYERSSAPTHTPSAATPREGEREESAATPREGEREESAATPREGEGEGERRGGRERECHPEREREEREPSVCIRIHMYSLRAAN